MSLKDLLLHIICIEQVDLFVEYRFIINRAANHYDFCRIITIFCSSLHNYTHILKTTINLPFPVMVPYMWQFCHCLSHTPLACLYFGEYLQTVTCSAWPLVCSSHGSCSRPYGLKAFYCAHQHKDLFIYGSICQ